jgi:hypothetical protein
MRVPSTEGMAGFVPMIMLVFVRRLRPGVTFEEFKAAWLAEPNHFGRPVLVTHGQHLEDHREILSYALLDFSREELTAALGDRQLIRGEAERHDRIDAVVERTVVKGYYEIIDEIQLS